MVKNKLIKPFLKWVGGKRYLESEIKKRVPKFSHYHEPFMGGGAILFSLQPKKATFNDINEDIINVYTVIKENVDELIKVLSTHKNEANYFYKIRELDRDEKKFSKLSDVEKAARIIYLNKTCFNGLFRVNNQGQFNAPFGRYKNPNFINAPVLKAVSKYLNDNNVTILNQSFEKLLSGIKKGSFVYLDPPYDPVSETASFTGYNLYGFDREDQKKLKEYCDKLNKKGVKFLLSNSATDFIKELYGGYNIDIVKAPRNINCDGTKRGKVDEVLVRNYEIKK